MTYNSKSFGKILFKNLKIQSRVDSKPPFGNVVKYDVNVDQNGSFNCTLEVVSGNYRLLDKSVTDDNDLSFIFEELP